MKSGVITTVFGNGQFASNGDGGPATEASTCMPDSIFVDSQKNIFVGEKNGYRVRKVDGKTGIVSTLVGNGTPGWGEDGLKGNETLCNSCESGLWADSDETVFWSDCSGRVRKIDGKSKIVTTVFGGTSIHDDGPPEKAFLRDLKFSSPSRGICLFDSYKNLTIPKRCAKTNSATDEEDAAGVL